MCVTKLDNDIEFLKTGFTTAVKVYTEKYNALNTPVETLKNCNWDVVEFRTLMQGSQALKFICVDCVGVLDDVECTDRQFHTCKALLKDFSGKGKQYLKNLYKKKRGA